MTGGPAISLSQMTPATAAVSLALNQQYEAMLSPLTLPALHELVEASCYARETGSGAAFLIAYDQDGAYESDNFDWFRARYDRFIYVDRIAVADHLQGRGIARAFYEDLIGFARERKSQVICAEVNIDPPNPASHAFHKKMGFESVGDAHVDGKHVEYYVLTL